MAFSRALLFTVGMVLAVPPVQGQTPQDSVRYTDATAPVSCMPADDCPVLSLDKFLRQVLRTSPSARATRLEQERAAAQLLKARGGFQPTLVSGYEFKTEKGKDKLNVLRSGVTWPLNLPASPTLTFDYRRGLGASIDPSVATSRVGETRLGLSISPLKGLLTDKSRAALDKARLAPARAQALQAQQRNRLLLKATKAFWDWVKARRELSISRDLLRLARQRQALITREAEAGEVPAVDSIEAARITASRRGNVDKAVRTAREKRIALATFLWTEDGAPASFRYAPPSPQMPPSVDTSRPSAAVETALSRRPKLRLMDVKQRQTQIERRLARARLRPDLKLEAQAVSYTESPLNVTDVKVGVKIDQPLFFRAKRSGAQKAQIKLQNLNLKRDVAERKVRADVESALVALSQARRRTRSARRNRRLARRLRQAEQRRFDEGESTLFVLNKREQSLAKARKQLVSAETSALKAYATYQWATGTIGDEYDAGTPLSDGPPDPTDN
jgi:outer membrane protein TolC